MMVPFEACGEGNDTRHSPGVMCVCAVYRSVLQPTESPRQGTTGGEMGATQKPVRDPPFGSGRDAVVRAWFGNAEGPKAPRV